MRRKNKRGKIRFTQIRQMSIQIMNRMTYSLRSKQIFSRIRVNFQMKKKFTDILMTCLKKQQNIRRKSLKKNLVKKSSLKKSQRKKEAFSAGGDERSNVISLYGSRPCALLTIHRPAEGMKSMH